MESHSDITRLGLSAFGGEGGSDPWTKMGLSSDFVNGTTTFSDITGFSFTPLANTNYIFEASMLLQTVATTNLPRVNLNVGAGQLYGGATIEYPSSATAKVTVNGWFTTGVANIQAAVGTAPVQGQPFFVFLWGAFRSGTNPGVVKLQLAAESAAANAAIAKVGSEFRYRVAA